jgi:hypothetical protein
MKRFIIICMGLFTASMLNAQTPAAFSYQAVVRDASGIVQVNQTVSFRITILEGSISGTAVYQETHAVTTNEFGLVTLAIGKGLNISGNIASIDWGGNTWFLSVELDPTGGSSFLPMGTTQLLSVPYAFHAKTVEYDKVDDADADPVNEIQELQLSGTLLSLSKGGGTVTLPSSGGGDNWGTQVVVTDATLSGNGLVVNPLMVADNGITSLKILDGSLVTADLADHTVSTAKLGNLAVSTDKIQNAAITTDKLANGAVVTDKISPGAVTGSRIAQDGAISGQALKWDGTTWAPANDLIGSSLWQQSESDIYFNTGKVGIGKIPGADLRQFQVLTGSIQAIAAENNSSSYAAIYAINGGSGPAAEFRNQIRIADGTQGTGKVLTSDVGGYTSWQSPVPDFWSKRGFNLYYTEGMVGIGDGTPDATLDVEGTVVIGAGGRVFSEIREITGTTGSSGSSTAVSYPSGYNQTNTRVLSVEINYNGTNWNTLGMYNTSSTANIGCSLGSGLIYLHYPDLSAYHSRAYRVLLMKVG